MVFMIIIQNTINMIVPAQLNFEKRIENMQNEIRMLHFHKDNLEFEYKLFLERNKSRIVVVKTINEADQDGFLNSTNLVLEEENLEIRKEAYEIFDELSSVVSRINARENTLAGYVQHSKRLQRQISDDQLAMMVSEARMKYPNMKGKKKEEVSRLLKLYDGGLTDVKQKISFAESLRHNMIGI